MSRDRNSELERLFGVGGTSDLAFQLASGLGKMQGLVPFRKFGMNDAVASGTQDMWPEASVRVLPTSAAAVAVSSASAADTSAGTGARTVTIEGLDADYLEIAETVSLNGVTPVNTTLSFFRVNRAYVATAGSGETNAGNISGSIGGNKQFIIEADEGQTHQTLYTVPAGKTLIVTGLRMGCGRMSGTNDLHVVSQIKLAQADTAWRSLSDIYLFNGEVYNSGLGSAQAIPNKTEIRMQVVSTTTTQAFGLVAGYLIDDDEIDLV